MMMTANDDLEKFKQARAMAFKLGFVVRQADDPDDPKRYTLVRQAVETHLATIDEVLAELKRTKS
jgi:regulator of RNase E activity RraB